MLKEGMNANLEKKKALCEKAESLKDSTEWKETAEILTKLQKEWKTIGPVSKNTRTLFGNVSLLHVITSLSKRQGHFFSTFCRTRESRKEEGNHCPLNCY